MNEIIINYYNSLDFLDFLKMINNNSNFNTKVYNKSGKKLEYFSKKIEDILIPNEGREGAVYLKHIIDNYNNLADLTIFIQDDLENHQSDYEGFLGLIENKSNEDFYHIPCTWRKDDKTIHRRFINNGYCDIWTLGDNYAIKKFTERFNIRLENYVTETCAFFMVRKSVILQYSIEFYKELYNWILENDENSYIFEHVIPLIFKNKKL
jgi:hypothetical protein